jgi:uncharacterized pyridoxal phosphate-containing UPF0001 family protein
MAEIGANLCAVRQRVDRAAGRSGRDPSAVELLVVTKTWPPEVIAEVLEAGHELLGENKLQEAWAKIPELPASARWHFIGHLQRNKARKALDLFEAIPCAWRTISIALQGNWESGHGSTSRSTLLERKARVVLRLRSCGRRCRGCSPWRMLSWLA